MSELKITARVPNELPPDLTSPDKVAYTAIPAGQVNGQASLQVQVEKDGLTHSFWLALVNGRLDVTKAHWDATNGTQVTLTGAKLDEWEDAILAELSYITKPDAQIQLIFSGLSEQNKSAAVAVFTGLYDYSKPL